MLNLVNIVLCSVAFVLVVRGDTTLDTLDYKDLERTAATSSSGTTFTSLGKCQLTSDGDTGTCMSTRLACTRAGGVVTGYCGSAGFCCTSKFFD